VLERDRAVERGREPEADAAFHLRADVVGVDGDAAIDGADDAVDLELAVLVDGDLGDLRHVRTERLVHRHAASALFAGLTRLQRLSPLCPWRAPLARRRAART